MRTKAIKWFNQMSIIDKSLLCQKYSSELFGRGPTSITGSEIEMMYRKEENEENKNIKNR